MLWFSSWFRRFDSAETRLSESSALSDVTSLNREYEELVRAEINDGGLADSAISLCVRHSARAGGGRPTYHVMVRLENWDRKTAVRLLLGQPMLDARVRQKVATHWLSGVTQFGGLWVHTSAELAGTPAFNELRAAIEQLEMLGSAPRY